MKKIFATLFVVFICFSIYSQDFSSVSGDWIRVKAEYKDGDRLPNNHASRAFMRYHFTKKDVYLVYPGNTLPSQYSRTGSILKIGPIQTFTIEEYTKKALTLIDAEGSDAVRYYLIPIDSFQVSGIRKYAYEVVNQDTIYTEAPGIEPIYPKGNHEFMTTLMSSFTQTVGFDFSYAVLKDGTIGDVTIRASTNPKLNKRLVQVVKKTSGKWIPATYKGKPINVRQTANIGLNNR